MYLPLKKKSHLHQQMGSEKLEFTDFYEGEFGKVNITCRCDVPSTNDVLV